MAARSSRRGTADAAAKVPPRHPSATADSGSAAAPGSGAGPHGCRAAPGRSCTAAARLRRRVAGRPSGGISLDLSTSAEKLAWIGRKWADYQTENDLGGARFWRTMRDLGGGFARTAPRPAGLPVSCTSNCDGYTYGSMLFKLAFRDTKSLFGQGTIIIFLLIHRIRHGPTQRTTTPLHNESPAFPTK